MDRTVPFYANTQDNTHCFQASMRMILKYFQPEHDYSWKQLEELSAKVEGMSTWPSQMLINLQKMGFEIILVEGFDPYAFVKGGAEYLRAAFGDSVADWQIKNSDIPQEQRLYNQLLALPDVTVETRIPTIAEMRGWIQDGYLIKCSVNSRKLDGKDGYVGHAVVLYDISDTLITLHNPGLPPHKGQQVTYADFEAAWGNPNDNAKNFIAIKPKETHDA